MPASLAVLAPGCRANASMPGMCRDEPVLSEMHGGEDLICRQRGAMGRLLKLVEQQQVQIDILKGCYEVLVDEADALRVCLEKDGNLQSEAYQAQLHRRKFQKILERHPCATTASAMEVLQTTELLHRTMRWAGAASQHQCASACRALHVGINRTAQRLYAIGGSDSVGAMSSVDRLFERAGRWEPVPSLPRPRSNLACLAFEGRLYVIGGTDGEQVVGTVECFDEEVGKWRSLPPMPTPRSGMAVAASSRHLYVIGGREGFRSLGIVERFHVSEARWERVAPMPSCRRFLAATSLLGKLYAVGGEDDRFQALSAFERFSENVGLWETLPQMPTRRRGLAAVAIRGKLYAVGGGQASPQKSPSLHVVERYHVEGDVWEALPSMHTPRMFLAAVALNGKLCVLGGSDGAQALRSIETYEESEGHWRQLTPMMPTRRAFFAAAVVKHA